MPQGNIGSSSYVPSGPLFQSSKEQYLSGSKGGVSNE